MKDILNISVVNLFFFENFMNGPLLTFSEGIHMQIKMCITAFKILNNATNLTYSALDL